MNKYLFIILLSFGIISAQTKNLPVVVVGDSLVGKNIDGVKMREVIGNVIITQGDVKITCKHAIQNIDKNEAVLMAML
jgi:lipopolysaccharide export system protein LptA